MKTGPIKYFFTLLCISSLGFGCCGPKNARSGQPVKQGISGFVGELTGNQMPGPGRPAQQPKGVSTVVYVYESTKMSEVEQSSDGPFFRTIRTKLVDSVVSDSAGRFQLALPAGSYSVFVRTEGQLYANSFDAQQTIAPAVVQKNRVTEVNITISANASF
ncbi:MAG TPA: carboxypeptidase-like regulatory domain-containing protein [Flavisolibacter sp.]|nr:carboxypeptidase-like regulatory domain-containing protein [Flavisolibacter sp.]